MYYVRIFLEIAALIVRKKNKMPEIRKAYKLAKRGYKKLKEATKGEKYKRFKKDVKSIKKSLHSLTDVDRHGGRMK